MRRRHGFEVADGLWGAPRLSDGFRHLSIRVRTYTIRIRAGISGLTQRRAVPTAGSVRSSAWTGTLVRALQAAGHVAEAAQQQR